MLCAAVGALLIPILSACTTGDGPPVVNPDDHLDPQSCQACHPGHYDEWAGSMHAYAADDPVFRAMNARGQRETDGALGEFCIRCHAPMALMEGATVDGLNLDEVPAHLRGVTCVYCHSAVRHTGDANAALEIRRDGVLRGGFRDPVEYPFHLSEYSKMHARDEETSSNLCGPCHDVVTPAGVHLERTFLEWKSSIFNAPLDEGGLSCAACHMPGRDGPAADLPDMPTRRLHDHKMPGVDVAMIDWPDRDGQRAAVERSLDTTLYAEVCVDFVGGAANEIKYTLENVAAGHFFPSGAAQDRRVWAEVRAYLGDTLVYERGVVPDGVPASEVAILEPDLFQIRDYAFDDEGEEAHMFWDVRTTESALLPVATPDIPPRDNRLHLTKTWTFVGPIPDRVEVALKVRPIGLEILRDLVATGDLDEAILHEAPTFTPRSAALVWTIDDPECVPAAVISTP